MFRLFHLFDFEHERFALYRLLPLSTQSFCLLVLSLCLFAHSRFASFHSPHFALLSWLVYSVVYTPLTAICFALHRSLRHCTQSLRFACSLRFAFLLIPRLLKSFLFAHNRFVCSFHFATVLQYSLCSLLFHSVYCNSLRSYSFPYSRLLFTASHTITFDSCFFASHATVIYLQLFVHDASPWSRFVLFTRCFARASLHRFAFVRAQSLVSLIWFRAQTLCFVSLVIVKRPIILFAISSLCRFAHNRTPWLASFASLRLFRFARFYGLLRSHSFRTRSLFANAFFGFSPHNRFSYLVSLCSFADRFVYYIYISLLTVALLLIHPTVFYFYFTLFYLPSQWLCSLLYHFNYYSPLNLVSQMILLVYKGICLHIADSYCW